LRRLFKKEQLSEFSYSIENSIKYFQKLEDSEFPLLKKLNPEKIFSKDIKEKLRDEQNEEENLIFTEMWERNICERILPVIKLDLENTPYGKPVPGRALYDELKKKLLEDKCLKPKGPI